MVMKPSKLRDAGRRVRWLLHELCRYPRFWARALFKPDRVKVHGVKVNTYTLPAGIQHRLYHERYERGEVRLFLAKYDPDDVVMEIGAGIGFVSTLCARILGSERVFSYEADPDLLPIAQATYALNDVRPTLTNGVLAAQSGTATFFVDDNFLSSSIVEKSTTNAKEIQVPQLEISAEMRRIQPTFVIMDIEGAETLLVPQIDWSTVNKLVLELHHPVIGEEGAVAIREHLEKNGLRLDRGLSTSSKQYYERVDSSPN